ncbi:unnamed protein product, partial [marine sediment metagenome]
NAVEFGGTPNKKAVMGKLMAERKDLRPQIKQIIPLLDQIIEEIKNLNFKKQLSVFFNSNIMFNYKERLHKYYRELLIIKNYRFSLWSGSPAWIGRWLAEPDM